MVKPASYTEVRYSLSAGFQRMSLTSLLKLASVFARPPGGVLQHYAIALCAFFSSLILRVVVDSWLPEDRGSVLFLSAVVLANIIAGTGPAILDALLSFVALWYALLPPRFTFQLTTEAAVELGTFTFACAVIIVLIHHLRLAFIRIEAERDKSQKAEQRLAADLFKEKLLTELGSALLRDGQNINSSLGEVLDSAVAISGANYGNIQLLHPNSTALTIAVQRGFNDAFLKFFAGVREDDASACSNAMKSTERVIVEDVLDSSIFAGHDSRQVLIEAGVRAVISTPLRSSTGHLMGMVSVHFRERHRPDERELYFLDLLAQQAADYLERKRAVEVQETLINELQHRSANLLTVIQAIASRSFSGEQSLDQAKAFNERLLALGRANRQVTRSSHGEASLRELVQLELKPFIDRVQIHGPEVVLSDQKAQMVALSLHELMTNAAKYGALSNECGRVIVAWKVEKTNTDDVLRLMWQEEGGPLVVPPTRRGFGSTLFDVISADTRLDYAATGLICEFGLAFDGTIGRERRSAGLAN
jgi:two-component sensor histidine kinase